MHYSVLQSIKICIMLSYSPSRHTLFSATVHQNLQYSIHCPSRHVLFSATVHQIVQYSIHSPSSHALFSATVHQDLHYSVLQSIKMYIILYTIHQDMHYSILQSIKTCIILYYSPLRHALFYASSTWELVECSWYSNYAVGWMIQGSVPERGKRYVFSPKYPDQL
jgi:hypothetical protein